MRRRDFLKYGSAGIAGLAVGGSGVQSLLSPRSSSARARSVKSRGSPSFTPFTDDLPIPPVVEPAAAFEPQCALPEGLDLEAPVFYEVRMQTATTQIIPGLDTEIRGYDALYPGPTFRARHNEPAIVRFHNDLDVDTIVHNHGGHQSAESDGSANVIENRVIHPGEFRDFCYPNIAPVDPDSGEQDIADFGSTQWYHDHMTDLTGENVFFGLAGFYLLTDDLERALIESGVLPSEEFDIPIVLQDRVFRRVGSEARLIYDPEDDNFDGVLGDVFVANGKAQPKLDVRRRKYRFRFLNGSNARFFELKLSWGNFLQIGADSWLLGHAVEPITNDRRGRRRGTIQLSPAERADVIVDFRNAPEEVFLENILEQDDGRGPDRARRRGTPLLKFVVDQDDTPVDNAMISPGQPLRPHTPIRSDEIVRTRRFEFERKNGRWAINDVFFDPDRDNARPGLNTAERWILENGGGGWAHPIHIHLEAQHIQRFSRRRRDPQELFNKDTVRLGPREEAEVFIKFRTFPGRFVFHCHNLEHEDMAMMGVFNVVGMV